MSQNPFFYGNPVSNTSFFGRKKPLRRVVQRILSEGQSTAIVGESRVGKSSLLNYLSAPEKKDDLYGEWASHIIFSSLDFQMMGGQFTSFHFWKQALNPVKEQFVIPFPKSAIGQQYTVCHDNNFGTFTLETLFRILKNEKVRLVLLLDEFDVLLHHPILNSSEFYGGLRSLASRLGDALTLVIASSLPLSTLNAATQEFNPTGSPFFNIFSEITLGQLPKKDVSELLALAGDRFTRDDRRTIRLLAGGHPYLLQASASALWDSWEDGIAEASERRRVIGQRIYREHKFLFSNTWRSWTPPTRKAFTSVALAHTEYLLPERSFLTKTFIEGMKDWSPELHCLEERGQLLGDDRVKGGWCVSSKAMLWWLADELVRAVRPDVPFENWIKEQEMDGLFTRKEKDQLKKVFIGAAKALRDGATTLIESFIKGSL